MAVNKQISEGIEHLYAKDTLAAYLRDYWLRVDVEKAFCRDGWVYFIPDIAVYDKDGIAGFYEVVFTHDVDLKKMHKIWNFANDCMRPVFLRTIEAHNAANLELVYMMNVIL